MCDFINCPAALAPGNEELSNKKANPFSELAFKK
jgi:hypothetical protein